LRVWLNDPGPAPPGQNLPLSLRDAAAHRSLALRHSIPSTVGSKCSSVVESTIAPAPIEVQRTFTAHTLLCVITDGVSCGRATPRAKRSFTSRSAAVKISRRMRRIVPTRWPRRAAGEFAGCDRAVVIIWEPGGGGSRYTIILAKTCPNILAGESLFGRPIDQIIACMVLKPGQSVQNKQPCMHPVSSVTNVWGWAAARPCIGDCKGGPWQPCICSGADQRLELRSLFRP